MSNSSNPAQGLTLLVEGRYVGLHRFFVPVQRGLNFQDPFKEYHEAEVRMNLRMSIVILADREWGCREATSEEAVNNYDLVFCLAVWPTRETKENMRKWKPWPGLPSCPPSWPGTPRYHALADKTYQNKEKCSTFLGVMFISFVCMYVECSSVLDSSLVKLLFENNMFLKQFCHSRTIKNVFKGI